MPSHTSHTGINTLIDLILLCSISKSKEIKNKTETKAIIVHQKMSKAKEITIIIL
jgi:hypothetical protein